MTRSLTIRERLRLRQLRRCERIVIVAHPDDESLWCGKTIADQPGTGVLCMTNHSDRARRRAFHSAMRALSAVGVILDVPDRRSSPPTEADEQLMSSAVAYILEPSREVTLFTHAPEGEYGHPLHQRVSAVVSACAGGIHSSDLWYFNFLPVTDPLPPLHPSQKIAALAAYFPDSETIPESDREHLRLSALEAPTRSTEYRGPSTAIAAIYGKDAPR